MAELIRRFVTPRPVPAESRQLFSDRALKAMIVPLLVERLLQLIVGIADTMMVSYAGEATVSGVSLDAMICTVFNFLFAAVATGGAVIVSQYIGRGSRKDAGEAAGQIFFIEGAVSLVCTALTLAFGGAMLAGLYAHVDAEVMSACRTYLRIVALSFPANAVYNAGAALYRSMGRTRVTMYVSIAMNLINIAGNAIGVFVLRAGAAGVAWPTVISWWIAAALMTAMCFNRRNQVSVRLRDMLRLRRSAAGRILRVAVPNAAEDVLFQAAKVLLGSMIATFGTSHIAANGIGQTLWSLSACMCTSMSPVFITVVGQCMGAGDRDAAAWYMRKLSRVTLLMAAAWNILVTLLAFSILPLYAVSAETRRIIGVIVIIHNIFAAVVQPYAMPLSAGLRSAGDVNFTMWASIFCTVVFRVALSYLFGLRLGLGVIGIALAMVLDWCLKALLDVIRFHSGKWKEKKVI